MFRKRLQHMNRYREIAMILTKHGFGYIISDIGLLHLLSLPKRFSADIKQADNTSIGPKLRYALEDLGPAFVKLGQILSTRRDVFPPNIIAELEKLQDEVQPCSFESCREVLVQQFDKPLEDIFSELDPVPLASASIGQVHLARLKETNQQVAVKVKRPDITEKVKVDLSIMKDIGQMLEQQFSWAEYYRLGDIIEEFSRSIRDELDYTLEANHTTMIAQQFEDDESIVVPDIHWDYTTESVLVMDFIDGVKITELDTIVPHDKIELSDRLVNCFFEQIFMKGFFHADPHPGNILFMPGNKIAMLDFGQVGRLSSSMRYHFSNLVIAVMNQETDDIIEAFMDMSIIDDRVDLKRLTSDVELLNQKYYKMKLSEISIGDAINDLFQTAQRNKVVIPAEYSILGKAMITLEALAEELNPELSILELAEPYGKKLVMERYHPKRLANKAWDDLNEMKELLLDIPRNTNAVLAKAKKGRLRVNITFPETKELLFKMDRISNRISFSITLLAFSIIVVGLIIGSTFGSQSSILTKLPAIEIGFVISFLMFLWLLYSIIKSGRF